MTKRYSRLKGTKDTVIPWPKEGQICLAPSDEWEEVRPFNDKLDTFEDLIKHGDWMPVK